MRFHKKVYEFSEFVFVFIFLYHISAITDPHVFQIRSEWTYLIFQYNFSWISLKNNQK